MNDIKIVVIGGGSGISVVLRGIKKITENITAIVTVADDGGSSGILREDLGMLPPGDIRNCILALSDTEPIMQQLMQYRFKDRALKNHNLGNVLIAGLVEMTGSFEAALSHIHDIFAVKGKVLPVTLADIILEATLEDGTKIRGESKIPYESIKKNSKIKSIRIEPEDCDLFQGIDKEIASADVVLIGPGSLYTSIVPNLLVGNLPSLLKHAKAKVVMCANLLTQPGETSGMSIEDHIFALEKIVGIRFIDVVFVNDKVFLDEVYEDYKKEGAHPLFLNDEGRKKLEASGIKIVELPFAETKQGYIRHDALLVANELINQIDTRIFS